MSCKSSQNDAATTCNRVAWFSLGSSTSVNFFAQGQAFGFSPPVSYSTSYEDGCANVSYGPFSSFCNFQFGIYYPGDGTTGNAVFTPGIQYAPSGLQAGIDVGVYKIYYDGSGSTSTEPFYALWVDLAYAGSDDTSADYWFYNNISVTMTATGGRIPIGLIFLGWSEAGADAPPNYKCSSCS